MINKEISVSEPSVIKQPKNEENLNRYDSFEDSWTKKESFMDILTDYIALEDQGW